MDKSASHARLDTDVAIPSLSIGQRSSDAHSGHTASNRNHSDRCHGQRKRVSSRKYRDTELAGEVEMMYCARGALVLLTAFGTDTLQRHISLGGFHARPAQSPYILASP